MAKSSSRKDFKWTIDVRADIQRDLFRLYKLVDDKQPLTKGKHDARKQAFSLLVGASFSLWRAAFLYDIKQSWPEMVTAERKLLEALLITNTVSFGIDRDCRDWMFGYYLSSTIARLGEAKDTLKVEGRAFKSFDRIRKDGLFGIRDTPQNLWKMLRATLVELIGALEKRLDR